MKIHLNEVFNTYEVTECDRKFGNEITLDGETLISSDDVKQAREEIDKLIVQIRKEYNYGMSAVYGLNLIEGIKLVIPIVDKLIGEVEE